METIFKEIVEKEAIAFNKKYNDFINQLIELEQFITYNSNKPNKPNKLNYNIVDKLYELKKIQDALERVQGIDADVMFSSARYALQSIIAVDLIHTSNRGKSYKFPHDVSIDTSKVNSTLVFLFKNIFLKELLQCSDSYEYHPETPRMIYI